MIHNLVHRLWINIDLCVSGEPTSTPSELRSTAQL